jgi:hypothetical protein
MRGARLSVAIAGFALVTMSCTGSKSVQVLPSYPKARVFDRGCPVLWPELLAAMNKAGFKLMQHDRSVWIANFNWGTAQLPIVHRPEMDLDRLALDQDGSWRPASALRVDAAVLVLARRDSGCEASVRVTYRGEQGGFWRARQEDPVSSGLFESLILSESGSALARKQARGRRPS